MSAPKQTAHIVALVLDFETGGLNSQTSAITQIAIHAIRLDNFKKLGSFVRYIYPYNKKEIKAIASKKKVLKNKFDSQAATLMDYEPRALEYSAIAMDKLYEQGEDINQIARDVLRFIEDVTPDKTPKNMKPVIIGQNITFDEGFLIQMFEYTGLLQEFKQLVRGWTDFYGNWHPQMVDTIHLGQLALCNRPNINSYKLEIMCEYLGIELDDAHDADADVTATTNVVAMLTKRMRSTNGVSDNDEIQMNKVEKSRKHFKI